MSNPWVAGARPKTLPAAIVPVFIGTAVAYHQGSAIWDRALLALVVSLALQVGVNYANDYSDGIRGTDEVRVGPLRLVATGTKPAAAVKRAAFLSFGVAMIAGAALVALTSPWLLVVGAVSVLAAWFYTGGKHPYGYSGFGELAVFVFFGLVAVMGTTYVQLEKLTWLSFVASIPAGLLAVALLLVNNLRDRPRDAEVGKKTLSVRIGDVRTRQLYLCCAAFPFVIAFCIAFGNPFVLLTALGLVALVPPVRMVVAGAQGRDLIAVLQNTGRLQLLFGLLFSLGLVLS
jgi:1,4-dihydroxy-2-naphthoate polyprenyltransferase